MLRKLLILLIMSYSAIAFGATINDPPNFEWTYHEVTADNPEEYYSGVLEYGEATLNIGGETLTTRAYRQKGKSYSIPGPTLRMTPGKKYVVQFENHSPYEPKSDVHNNFKDPNVTNVHTHGLHISPAGPSDDVLRFFEGGRGGDYVYDIPAKHMGGTYWYHAHHHGATFLKVATGALGSIIIDDGNDGLPANVTAMREQNLVINFLDPTAAGTGGDTLVSGTLGAGWLVNGQVGGTVVMPPDTWQHWRVLVADPDAGTWDLNIGSQCEVALMARDGVWRRAGIPKELPTNSITMNGASRSDLAVKCSAASELRIDNTVVATIETSGTEVDPAVASAHPYADDGVSVWNALRPAYLQDMRNVSSVHTETINMGARTINGSKFDVAVPTFDLQASATQEWTIKGATMHPFHLHVYHMQALSDCGDHEAGEFYDTIAANCKVRFDLNTATSTVYDGATIMHCHILAHEDQGAMGWLRISGSGLLAPPTYPAGTSYSLYYTLGGGGGNPPLAPSSLAATAVSSSQIDLSWVDNASDETNFEVERSTDGVNFTLVPPPLDANVTSYSDSGLAASTTYSYQVRATNGNGASGYSNIASATTQPGGVATELKVGSVTVSTVSAGKGQKSGRAVVVVTDDVGTPVAGAIVSGTFTGSYNEAAIGTTDANGSATIDTSVTAKGGVSFTFCVDSISGPLPYVGTGDCGSL